MSYEQKYLKYKQKYLELKSKLNNINTETDINNNSTQYQLSETPVNNMNGGDFYSFLGKTNIENHINSKAVESFNNNVENTNMHTNMNTENIELTETPQDGGYNKIDVTKLAPFAPSPGVNPPNVKTDGGIVNTLPPELIQPSNTKITDISVSNNDIIPNDQSDLGDKSVPVNFTEANNKYSVESEHMSDVQNTTDIENIFKQLGGKRKSKKDIDDSSDIFGSSDSISLDDSNSSSDYSATPPVPSSTNPFEESVSAASPRASPFS